jgi:hypothetical protein
MKGTEWGVALKQRLKQSAHHTEHSFFKTEEDEQRDNYVSRLIGAFAPFLKRSMAAAM